MISLRDVLWLMSCIHIGGAGPEWWSEMRRRIRSGEPVARLMIGRRG